MPLVTVVTPCYNAEPFIEETIESVRRQTFFHWEHVVVDDGSTDGSAARVARRVQTSPQLRLIRHANCGVCRTRNVGAASASPDSRYLLFLDADDCLHPDMLKTLVTHLEEHPEVGIAYCLYAPVDAAGTPQPPGPVPIRYDATPLGLRRVPDDELETPALAVFSGAAIPSVSLIRRTAFEAEGGFDEQLGQPEEDVDLFTRIALRAPVHRLPHRLVSYRRHAGQVSGDVRRLEKQRRKLIQKWQRMSRSAGPDGGVQEALWRNWEGKVVPLIWLRAARTLFSDRRVLRPALLAAGSAFRYVTHLALGAASRVRSRLVPDLRSPAARRPSEPSSRTSTPRPVQTI